MHDGPTNPLIVALLFVLRCMIPLFLMLAFSALLKKLGVISQTPSEPENGDHNSDEHNHLGGVAHDNS